MLREVALRQGAILKAQDVMDDGSVIALTITIDREQGTATFDFDGLYECRF